MSKVWPVALVLALLLAGCVGSGDDDPPEAPAAPTGAPGGPTGGVGGPDRPGPAPNIAPTWSIGDWWSYKVAYESGESYDATVVVHAEDGGNWYVTATDRDLMLRAAFTHYPTFGAVRKADLAQMIHGDNVQYLKFPLENATWSAPFRDFTGDYRTEAATLQTGKGPVPGFVTTMRDTSDGLIRIANGYSPDARWFTNFTFDFDGYAPADVTYTLQDWGTGFTGALPVVEILDHVHRPFPTVSLAPPDPAAPPGPPDAQAALDSFSIEEGASIVWGLFAGAGGPGFFRMNLGHESSGQNFVMEWQPTQPGGTFAWTELDAPDAGQWGLSATGAAQSFSFLFVEANEVRTSEVTL